MKAKNIRWRWVYHSVWGPRLFLDVIFPKGETCTKQREVFIFELKEIHPHEKGWPTPVNILKLLAGSSIPPMPKEFKKWMK